MNISANNVIVEDDLGSFKSRKRRSVKSEQVSYNAFRKKGFFNNMRSNADKKLLRALLLGASGAIIYPLVPTLFQSITERDMSGFKGLIMGVGAASILGLATGKPEITIGACSAAGTHILYSKGTKIIEDLTNTQIYRMNPHSVVYNELEIKN